MPQQFIAKKWRGVVPAALCMQPATKSKSLRAGKLPPTLDCDHAAKYISERMAKLLNASLVRNPFSPELIQVGHSLHHRSLFPPSIRKWSQEHRDELVGLIYEPYRNELRHALRRTLSQSGQVLHLSIQTFPLKSAGRKPKLRRADMGLLYDPSHEDEVDLSLNWIEEMYYEVQMLRVRRNYPTRGTNDCITKAMRAEFAHLGYVGLELRINQAWAGRPVAIRDQVIEGICWSLKEVLDFQQAEAA